MTFTCPNCGARNSQFQDCGCDEPEEVDDQADPEADAAEHRWETREQR